MFLLLAVRYAQAATGQGRQLVWRAEDQEYVQHATVKDDTTFRVLEQAEETT